MLGRLIFRPLPVKNTVSVFNRFKKAFGLFSHRSKIAEGYFQPARAGFCRPLPATPAKAGRKRAIGSFQPARAGRKRAVGSFQPV